MGVGRSGANKNQMQTASRFNETLDLTAASWSFLGCKLSLLSRRHNSVPSRPTKDFNVFRWLFFFPLPWKRKSSQSNNYRKYSAESMPLREVTVPTQTIISGAALIGCPVTQRPATKVSGKGPQLLPRKNIPSRKNERKRGAFGLDPNE